MNDNSYLPAVPEELLGVSEIWMSDFVQKKWNEQLSQEFYMVAAVATNIWNYRINLLNWNKSPLCKKLCSKNDMLKWLFHYSFISSSLRDDWPL